MLLDRALCHFGYHVWCLRATRFPAVFAAPLAFSLAMSFLSKRVCGENQKLYQKIRP